MPLLTHSHSLTLSQAVEPGLSSTKAVEAALNDDNDQRAAVSKRKLSSSGVLTVERDPVLLDDTRDVYKHGITPGFSGHVPRIEEQMGKSFARSSQAAIIESFGPDSGTGAAPRRSSNAYITSSNATNVDANSGATYINLLPKVSCRATRMQ